MPDPRAATRSLLGPADPDPVMVHGAGRSSPFVIVCDHAGNAVPQALGDLGLAAEHLQDHIAWDLNAWSVSRTLADTLGAAAIGQAYSRLVVDCNRQVTAADSIAPASDGVWIPANCDVSGAERERRAQAILAPYQDHIARHLESDGAQAPPCIVSMHSFTPKPRRGTRRPWHIGVISGPDGRIREGVLAYLAATSTSLVIGDNEPYAVNLETDYTLPVHAERTGTCYVEFELRNDLFGGAAAQRRVCELLAEALAHAYARLHSR